MENPLAWRAMRTHLLLLLIWVLVAGCEDRSPIKIGFIGNLEGRASDISETSLHAIQLAFDEVNGSGGINARQLELVVKDDMGSAEKGALAAKALADKGVTAILGPNLSSVAEGVIPVVNDARLITVSSTVASLRFAGNNDYFFRVQPTTRQFGTAYALHARNAGYDKIAVAFDQANAVYTVSWLDEFRAAFATLGGEVVASIPFNSEAATVYSAVADDLLSSAPDAVLFVANGIDTARLSQQVRMRNDDKPMIAASWAASEGLIESGGQAIEGLVLVQVYDRNDKGERYTRFRTAFHDRFEAEPGFATVLAYESALFLFAALRQWDGTSDLKLTVDALEPVQGLQQEIAMDEYGDTTREMVVVSVQGGEFVRR